jgi:general secretion pathway protein D
MKLLRNIPSARNLPNVVTWRCTGPFMARAALSICVLSAASFTPTTLLSMQAQAQELPPFPPEPGVPSPLPGVDADQSESENGDVIGDDGSNTEINIKNAEIASVIKIFSRKTKRNYILDDKVKGKVSIFLPSKVTPEEALRILEAVLAYKGFTSVPIGENLWKIVLSREARQTTIPTVTEEGAAKVSAAVVTRLLSLKYIDAEQLKGIITPLVSSDGLINAYAGTNSLIIIDSEDNIRRIEKIISSLDLPASNRDMTIIPIKFADATEISDKLSEILGLGQKSKDTEDDGSGLPGVSKLQQQISNVAGNNAPPSASALSTSSQGQSRGREPKIIADERTNSIIIIADEDTTTRIRALIEQLDSKIDLSDSKFYVYRCQHAKADELASVLSELGGGGSGGLKSSKSGSSGFDNSDSFSGNGSGSRGGSSRNGSSALTGRSSKSSKTQDRLSKQNRSSGTSSSNQSAGSAGSVQLGDNILVAADPSTNSLIIRASKSDYEKLKNLLEKLDVKRRQVLVEAMILEVSIGDTDKLGASFMGSNGNKDGGAIMRGDFNGDLTNLFKDPQSISDFSVAAASAGALKLPGGISIPTQTLLINALKSNDSVNVLSSPTLLTTDNEEAEIVVGQNVPFISSTSSNETNLSNTFNQVDRQDVGITLRLTPQISSGETVTMKIFTEVSSISAQDPKLGPTTRIRTSDTTVISKDGQMIVIGGLIADDVKKNERGIPLLKDIPLLGWLFKTQVDENQKTNLLIFITPKIIKDQYDIREATIDKRDEFKNILDSLGEKEKREEVLDRASIDRVTEAEQFEGQKPTTILSPDSTSNGTNPGVKTELPSPSAQATPLRMHLSAIQKDPQQALRSMGRFIVFKVDGSSPTLPGRVLKSYEVNDGLLAVSLPDDASDAIKGFFFDKGSRRGLSSESGVPTVLSIAGVFSSRESAVKNFPSLAKTKWYTPPPQELLTLGTGAWTKQ